MRPKLAFVHTSPVIVPLFGKLASELLPEVDIFHTVDESLIKNTMSAGHLTKATILRLIAMIGLAHEAGATAVMVTCSSLGRGIELARELYEFPILRVDEAMAERAVQSGSTIGVAATVATTLEPTMELLSATAARLGREVELKPVLCSEAFAAVLAGDGARHDALLRESLAKLRAECDVVALAQASMARIAPEFDGTPGAALLSSPELAVRQARERLLG